MRILFIRNICFIFSPFPTVQPLLTAVAWNGRSMVVSLQLNVERTLFSGLDVSVYRRFGCNCKFKVPSFTKCKS